MKRNLRSLLLVAACLAMLMALSGCDKLFHKHTPGPAATCTQPQVCTECGAVLQQATGHTPGPEATCITSQVCTVCGTVLVEKGAHQPGPEPTCMEPQTCTLCGEVLQPALGHDYQVTSGDGLQKTCTRCGSILNLTQNSKNQTIIDESVNKGHYNVTADPYYSNSVLVCGEYGMEYFSLNSKGNQSYADMLNRFAKKFPQVNVSCLLIPKTCAFYAPGGSYPSRLENQTAYIQSTYDLMDSRIKKADCIGVMAKHVGEYMFYRTDHHWTSLGAYYASVAFCSANDIAPRRLSEYKTVINTDFVGTLYSFAGEPASLSNNPDYTVAHLPSTEYTLTYTTNGSTGTGTAINTRYTNYASMFMCGDQAYTDIVTQNKNGRKLILFKESYGNAFAPYMIDYFEEVIVIDIRKDTQSIASIIRDHGITDALIINNVQASVSLSGYLDTKLAS